MRNPIKSTFVAMALAGVGTVWAVGAFTAAKRMGHPPVIGVARGYRGTGLVQLYNPATLKDLWAQNQIPVILPPADASGDRSGDFYDNVRVLKNISTDQMTRLMVSMAHWVAPVQGCSYCHNLENPALDTKYTKVVARRMLQMTQNINANWKSHVKNTGVTCYTCHRGNPVPQYIWFNNPGPGGDGMAETQTQMAHPTLQVADTALPYDPFSEYLEKKDNIRVQGVTALPTTNRSSVKQTEFTYAMMIVIAKSLGVNCDYCHNTRSFRDWSQSTPARMTAWYGIRMVRDLNNNYMDSLTNVFPANRKGVEGDSPKIYCATCHQGVYKPLYGVSMMPTFKTELGGPPITTAPLMAPYNPPPDSAEAPEAAPTKKG